MSRRRLEAWWLAGQPPLGGRLRFVFYAGLAVALVASPASPVRMLESSFRAGGPELYEPPRLLAVLGLDALDHEALYAAGRWLVGSLLAGCALSAIGFLGRAPRVLTAVSLAALHGLVWGSIWQGRSWFLPMYACAFLAVAVTRDGWSLDELLHRRLRGYPDLGARARLGCTGFARQGVLVAAVALLFSAGWSKLCEAGPRWGDGCSLGSYVAWRPAGGPAFEPLAAALEASPALCALLSTGTLLVELGAALALVTRLGRHLAVVVWTVLHLGVWLLLGLDFLGHAWTYVLLVDWGWLLGRAPAPVPAVSGPRVRAGVLAGTAAGAALFAAALVRAEWWPFAHLPMYASYVCGERSGGFSREDYRSAEGLRRIAAACPDGRCQWAARNALRSALRFRVALVDGSLVELSEGTWGVFPNRRLGGLAVDALLEQVGAGPEAGPGPATALLERIAPLARRRVPAGARDGQLQLVYRLGSGELLLGAAELGRGDGGPAGE